MFNRNKNYRETGTEYAALTAVFNLIVFVLAAVALYAGFSLLAQLGGLLETLTLKMPMLILLLVFGGVVVTTTAQTATDEQLIRELIEQEAAGKRNVRYADNAVFASDVLPRPVILKKTREPETALVQTVSTTRRNQILKVEVRRIVVAESKDIAYEYSDFTISYDQPDTTRDGYTGSMLRVWLKTNGEWRIDAAFTRQNTGGENLSDGSSAKNEK